MNVQATILSIDLNPEFGEITGTEAVIVVGYTNPLWSNAPTVTKTVDVTKTEALAYRVGQTIPLVHV